MSASIKYNGYAIAALLDIDIARLKLKLQREVHGSDKEYRAISHYLPHITIARDIPSWQLAQLISELPSQKLEVCLSSTMQILPANDFLAWAIPVKNHELGAVYSDLNSHLVVKSQYEFMPHVTIDSLSMECDSDQYLKANHITQDIHTHTCGWVLYTRTGKQIVISVFDDQQPLIDYAMGTLEQVSVEGA